MYYMAQIGIIAIVFLVLIGICMVVFAICYKKMQQNQIHEELLLEEEKMSHVETVYPHRLEDEE